MQIAYQALQVTLTKSINPYHLTSSIHLFASYIRRKTITLHVHYNIIMSYSKPQTNMEDPCVIVGMACRFPGEDSSPEGFWNMVSKAKSAHGKMPSSRFNIDAYYHPSPDRAGSINTTHGYFLQQDPAHFDSTFFSMTANEAAGMDPM